MLIVISGMLLISGAALFGDFENAKPLIATPATGILSVLIMVPALLVGFDVILSLRKKSTCRQINWQAAGYQRRLCRGLVCTDRLRGGPGTER